MDARECGHYAHDLPFFAFIRCMNTHVALQKFTSQALPVIVLLLAVGTWGSSYAIQKDIFDRIGNFDFVGITFGMAAIFSAIVFWPQLRRASKETWICGVILGLIYTAAEEVQLWGLSFTNASVTGFITGTYVVLVPLLSVVLFKARYGIRIWVAAALALIGLAVMTLHFDGSGFGWGEALVLLCAVFYALQVIFIERFVRSHDLFALIAIQMIVMGALCLLIALPGGVALPHAEHLTSDWLIIAYNAIIIAVGSLIAQMWAQARMSATQAAIVMTSDPIWGAVFAVLLLREEVTRPMVIGGALIILAMLLSQIDVGKLLRRIYVREMA